mgnify:FL=1
MRSDLLASVVVVDEGAPAATLPHLAALMPELAAHFRYYEVVYVVGEGARGAVEAAGALIATLPNLRIILASEGTGFHRRRLLGAMEAIGDVVAIYDPDELSVAQLAEEIGQAFVGRQIRIGWYQSARARDWGYRLLSLASRNVVSARAARTWSMPT